MELTRPELIGNDHAVTSTHWMATAIGAEVLARGGNAADAAAATGFALQVVEPHLNGPGGEAPMIIRTPDGNIEVIDGQGVAPAGATIGHYRSEGLTGIPGTGLLAATVPSSFATWMTLLERHGTWEVADVLAPAITLADTGYPMLPAAARSIDVMVGHFTTHWPSSAETWLSNGVAPRPYERWRNPVLAATWRRIVDESSSGNSREARVARAREVFMSGFVAEEIERFVSENAVMDSSGAAHRGVLTAADMAGWAPRIEQPETVDYRGWTVYKTSFWGQGPVFLQQLRLFDALGLAETEHRSPDYLHLLIEGSKLAFADREAWYGDPLFVDVPRDALLGTAYASDRAGLVGDAASMDLRPGSPDGRMPRLPQPRTGEVAGVGAGGSAGVGEPTVAKEPPLDTLGTTPAGVTRGDTCHLDVTDRNGMTISVTPSGGWMQSSPTIPALGFCLGSRAQMFWLDEGLPSSLAPGRRPRTTLSPSLAVHEDGAVLSFGTPGGDQQDQWSLGFFLSVVHGGLGLQAAIEEPMLHHLHVPESFAPRLSSPGVVLVEPRMGTAVTDELRARGHLVRDAADWSLGRTTAVSSGGPDGFVRAAANPRGQQGYAIAR